MPNLTGDELFQNSGLFMNFNLLDFWSWYASDLLNHPVRGIYCCKSSRLIDRR